MKVLLFFLLALPSWANKVDVNASFDREEVAVGDTFTYTLSISSGESVGVTKPMIPIVPGLELLNQWTGSESRSSFANGQFTVQRTQTFNYLFEVNRTGEIVIPPVNVVVDGKTYSSKAARLKVVQLDQKQQQQRRQQQQQVDPMDEVEDLFSMFLQRRGIPGGQMPKQGQQLPGSNKPINPNDAFFVRGVVDKEKVYVGEQITASWYLYTRGQIRDLDTIKYPTLSGFWKEEIEMATRLNFEQEVIDGVPYYRALLVSYALFPIKAGKAKVDGYKARCTVISPTSFGFGQPYVFTKVSPEITIEVLDLPLEGRPEHFSGAVGNFRVRASLDQNNVPANQPVSLKVRFEGRGNAKGIDLPPVNWPNSLEFYDQKSESKFSRDGSSFKEFDVILIPREPGHYEIPPISTSYFDPDKKAYVRIQTDKLSLNVGAGQGGPNNQTSPNGVAPQAQKQAPLTAPAFMNVAEYPSFFSRQWPVTAWGIAFAGLLGVLTAYAFIALRAAPRRNLSNELVRRLKKSKVLASDGKWREFGVELTNIIYMALGELSGHGGAVSNIESLLATCPVSFRKNEEQNLKNIMSKLEVLSFAPENSVGSLKEPKELASLWTDVEMLLNRSKKHFQERDL